MTILLSYSFGALTRSPHWSDIANYYGYPKFRWINDDTLSIELGKVRAVWREVDRADSIHITYAYTKVGTN
ncbi:MAG: hypothetical protein WBG11_14805 [Methylocella sp.]